MAQQQMTPTDPEWRTTEEVAQHFRVTARTILRWADAGYFEKVLRLGPDARTVRIHRTELDRPAGGRSAV